MDVATVAYPYHFSSMPCRMKTDSGVCLTFKTLLFWAWQRWEVEVCHRELKTTFDLGHKQCFNPKSAILSVQGSAWVYSVLILTGYKTFGLARALAFPTRWWRGSGRWSFATLLRSFRASLWGQHQFQSLFAVTPTMG